MMMIIEIKWKCIAGAKKENYNIIFFSHSKPNRQNHNNSYMAPRAHSGSL